MSRIISSIKVNLSVNYFSTSFQILLTFHTHFVNNYWWFLKQITHSWRWSYVELRIASRRSTSFQVRFYLIVYFYSLSSCPIFMIVWFPLNPKQVLGFLGIPYYTCFHIFLSFHNILTVWLYNTCNDQILSFVIFLWYP